jgi:hypothetical protein
VVGDVPDLIDVGGLPRDRARLELAEELGAVARVMREASAKPTARPSLCLTACDFARSAPTSSVRLAG